MATKKKAAPKKPAPKKKKKTTLADLKKQMTKGVKNLLKSADFEKPGQYERRRTAAKSPGFKPGGHLPKECKDGIGKTAAACEAGEPIMNRDTVRRLAGDTEGISKAAEAIEQAARGADKLTQELMNMQYPKRRVVIPEGHNYTVFNPLKQKAIIHTKGQTFNEFFIEQLVHDGILPKQCSPSKWEENREYTKEDAYVTIMNLLHKFAPAGQNNIVANVLQQMTEERETLEASLASQVNMLGKRMTDATTHKKALQAIRQGGLESLEFAKK